MVNSIVGSELGSTVGIAPARRRAWELHRVWDQHRDQRLGSCWSGSSLESTYIMGSNAGSNLRDQHWWGGWGGGRPDLGSNLGIHCGINAGYALAGVELGSPWDPGSTLGSICGINPGKAGIGINMSSGIIIGIELWDRDWSGPSFGSTWRLGNKVGKGPRAQHAKRKVESADIARGIPHPLRPSYLVISSAPTPAPRRRPPASSNPSAAERRDRIRNQGSRRNPLFDPGRLSDTRARGLLDCFWPARGPSLVHCNGPHTAHVLNCSQLPRPTGRLKTGRLNSGQT